MRNHVLAHRRAKHYGFLDEDLGSRIKRPTMYRDRQLGPLARKTQLPPIATWLFCVAFAFGAKSRVQLRNGKPFNRIFLVHIDSSTFQAGSKHGRRVSQLLLKRLDFFCGNRSTQETDLRLSLLHPLNCFA